MQGRRIYGSSLVITKCRRQGNDSALRQWKVVNRRSKMWLSWYWPTMQARGLAELTGEGESGYGGVVCHAVFGENAQKNH